MPTYVPLFTAEDLSQLVPDEVEESKAARVERVVWGWLSPALGLTERPDQVSDQLFSWAVELGAIFHENPTGLSTYHLGQERFGYSSERRAEILSEATASTAGVPATASQGSFPDAQAWPDPIEWC
jgi:hypothetical protein